MTFKTLLRRVGAPALVGAMALTALPGTAHADERPGRWSADRGTSDQDRTEARPQVRESRQQARGQRAQAASQQPTVRAAQDRTQNRSGGGWNRGDNRNGVAEQRSGRDWNRRDNTNNNWGQARAAQAQAQAAAQARAQADAAQRSQQWQRNGSYADRARNSTYQSGYRDGRRVDQRQDRYQQQNAYRSGYRDGVRTDNYRDGRSGNDYRYDGRNYQRWSNDWRRDNRYNWYGYRNANRNVFRLGTYYSPYRNYRYSRVGIGFTLGSLFYGNNYWINDPWQYRLPPAYGPYRWIRYYDDALLVNVYTGQVADVIHDFFW
ncbi:RcnB family protein [Tsuneonella amylolytica]|uniref:RcnB family protein n=1 Tax=Tsuneonella amylolytica TaxID=2338327 RepID=UPI000EA8B479|nr:RcnB family protein [Tsuneonella amylolytica]